MALMNGDRDLTERMSALAKQWERDGDRRAIFLNCYTLMTGNMLTATKAGEFQDDAWVETLIHHFASYYFVALEAYSHLSEGLPDAWRIAYQAAADPETMVLQNLLLGINAHINYDLALAVTDLLDPEWPDLPDGQRQARYKDYCYVNQIIAETIDAVQDDVLESYAPELELIDILMGPVDEWLTSILIDHWRDEVWEQAVTMLESPAQDRRERMRQALAASSLDRARLILKGQPF